MTVEPPALVSVAGKLWVVPVVTDPKLKVEGDMVSVPGAIAVTLSGSVRVEFEAFELTVRDPLSVPAVGGAQVMFIFMLWFGASV